MLAEETLDRVLEAHYASDAETAKAVQQLIRSQGRGSDQAVRNLVLKLHHYTQTLRDPAGWFEKQLAMFQSPEPRRWEVWLLEGLRAWRNRWEPALRAESGNTKAAECAACLQSLPDTPSRAACAAVLEGVRGVDLAEWPRGKKTEWRKPLAGFFEEAAFLRSLAVMNANADPLAEDWGWVRSQMATLLELAREFSTTFSDAKREQGAVDFHDLEQHALRLLRDPATGQPSEIARQWRGKLRFVFVDEYQDINEAQDAILKALSREEGAANRFLVGDVKQSIYRFRLADPHIFQAYTVTWGGREGRIISLADNFRSREAILGFVNSLFGALMRREIGGVPYEADAQLRFGDPANRGVLSTARDATSRVELHLRITGRTEEGDEEAGDTPKAGGELQNLEEAEKEARLVALRLRELHAEPHLIWDGKLKALRPARWSDMAVLLRSPSGKAESYAKEFARLGIPLLVRRGGFYDSVEVTDLLSLLQVLDNPLQDIPVAAVLHSPLVGMSLDELAAVRLAFPKGHLWTALQRHHETGQGHSGWAKADRFLKDFTGWRRLARQESLSHCLEAVLSGTHYGAWLLAQSRGEQRRANVQRLQALARQFDRFQRQGLYRFLRFIEAQQAAQTEPEVGAVPAENSVSLMSIHQSKGLEFPVVVAADLGKPFNLADLRAEIILDEHYGLCPQVKPPHTGGRYPSLPYWLARQRQRQELLGEEMRLLYVALTRARDTLILTGTLGKSRLEKHWREPAALNTPGLLAARNYLDWLGAWAANSAAMQPDQTGGSNRWWHWTIYEDDEFLHGGPSAAAPEPDAAPEALDDDGWQALRARLGWKYQNAAATKEPAKTSVTALRRRAEDGNDAEARPLFQFKSQGAKIKGQGRSAADGGKLSASELGTAHHVFMQRVALECTGSEAELRREAERLAGLGALTAAEIPQLDFGAIAAFWQSDLGQRILGQQRHVRREFAFTARFAPGELPGAAADGDAGEFVVVQGTADLVVLLPGEVWLLDFKTDDLSRGDLEEKVRQYEPQLKLYAQAFSRIYQRPVTELHLHFLSAKINRRIKN